MNWQPEIDGRRHTYGLESKYLLDIHEPFSKSEKKTCEKTYIITNRDPTRDSCIKEFIKRK